MKKLFKIISVLVVVSVVIIGLFIGGVFAKNGIKKMIRNNNRINNSTTLSKYIEYHGSDYINDSTEFFGFYAKSIEADLLKNRDILYFDDNYMGGILVLDDYTVYETAFKSDKVYSNGKQYKEKTLDFKIKRLQIHNDIPYLISEDDKCYRYIHGNITEVNEDDLDYIFIGDENVIKIYSGKNVNGIRSYYVLKSDGQIYEQYYKEKFNETKHRTELNFIKEILICSNEDYGHIEDFFEDNYYLDNKNHILKIVSNKGLYYLENKEQEYIDIEVTKKMVSSDIYDKYREDVKYINVNFVFTNDNNIIKTDMLCRDIDKDVLSDSEVDKFKRKPKIEIYENNESIIEDLQTSNFK